MRETQTKSTKRLIEKSFHRLILDLQTEKDLNIEKERLKTSN